MLFFRKKNNVEKRDAEERMKIMIDAAPFCVIFWDNELNLIDCNQEAVKMFELSSKNEFIKKYFQLSPRYQPDGISSLEKGTALIGKALDEGLSRYEWMHQKLNGEQIPTEITCVRTKHKGEYTVTEYIRDLREQKAILAEIRKAEMAEESSNAKSDFLAKMSHEIRTPMNAILGITEIQLQDDTVPQVTKDALERIYHSANLLLGIINDILDLSKIEAGRLDLVPVQYDIASFIHDTVQLNMMRYETKPIEFKLKVDENIPAFLYGDELRIKQILNNLLSNAFKYTNEGMIILEVAVNPPNEGHFGVTMVFTISDTGQGMTEEQVKLLGSKYARFNAEANRKTEGTGLGMNITRNLIELMRGDLQIRSIPGMGSTFTVLLPQESRNSEPIGKELAENLMQLNFISTTKSRSVQIKREYMPYGRVLIVDDVETNLYVGKGLMASYGLSIDTAMNGFEAIDKIRNGNTYDIVFMDHMMPVMDGIEATKKIRKLGYTDPIVALTANALAGQAEMFLQNGFDDFISKPIDIRQLNVSLNKFVRDKYPNDVVEAARKQKNSLVRKSQKVDAQLAEVFLRDAKRTVILMESIYQNKCRSSDDISMFIINVHAMKSALANVGEISLSEKAGKLEQAGRDKNSELILTELPYFLELLYEVIHKFESKETHAEEVPSAEGNNSLLKEKLLEIHFECSAYNKKAAKDLLAELKEKAWPHKTNDFLGTIAENLLHSDFDETIKAIEEFIKQL